MHTLTDWMSRAALIGLVIVLAGCGGGDATTGEADHSSATSTASGLEPNHGGRIVELDGSFDAELVVVEGGMAFVYLYDADGNPVPYEGKEVWLKVTTPDGKSQELDLEGMGTGAGAHFMNPLDAEMVDHVLDEGAYSADISVETDTETQKGSIDIQL